MSRTRRVAVHCLLPLFVFAGALVAQPASELANRIDAFVQPFLDDDHLSGQLLVAIDGTVVYERAFGMANFELGVPATHETRFNIASISKPMTGILGQRLVEEGKLSMDDKLAKWLPDFPRGDEITVAHLFRHQAGIPHRVTDDEQESQAKTAADMVELAKVAPLLFDPGTSSTYSSGGYSVAARVLELAGGASYEDLLSKYVLAPAAMSRSLHPSGHALIEGRADSYLIGRDGAIRNSTLKHYSFLVGAGSVFSTARDLHSLQRSLLDGRFGDSAARLRDGNLKWNGRTNGFRAFADFHGETGVSVVFTGNLLTGAADRIRSEVPRIAAGEEVATPQRLALEPVEVPPAKLAGYEGVYQLRPGTELELSVDNGAVSMSGWTLVPLSDTSFFSPQDYARIEVILKGDGSVERLDWKIGEAVYPMPRIGPLAAESDS